MTAMTQLTKEYAQALFALAGENEALDEVSASLDAVLQVFSENPLYKDLLSSPGISKDERVAAIDEAFSGRINEFVVSFLSLLCERGRIAVFEDCVKEFKLLCDFANQISTARVVSAVELTPSQTEALRKKLEKMCGHSVRLETVCDKTLLGGMVVTVDGKVIDGSVKHKLHELKDVMYG